MNLTLRDVTYLVFAVAGAGLFWTGLYQGAMRPSEPHPGLRDDALKEALQEDWTHRELSYYSARKNLFEKVDGDGRRTSGVYTGAPIKYLSQPLPNKGMMEHTWELTRLPAEARTDLHHLYPVLPEANAARLNLHYGEVMFPLWSRGGSKAGPSSKVKPVFEVRPKHRGNAARAMFYIATMYDKQIPADEEKILKEWHDEDPVDKAERTRNDTVQKLQSSRNPFVDHPGLVDRISDF
jgi:hypothetical protein